MANNEILLEKRGKVAIITLNRADKLNALNGDLYYDLASKMNEIAAMPDIFITVLTGTGRFFSA
jgi:peroxisomal 3,2-trans-enoyl-CoA isomerase